MRLTDLIFHQIMEQLNLAGGTAEIARNELALSVGCVPSQVSYVITSRFTPERGYLVESRRGGGGFIRITRVILDSDLLVQEFLGRIGPQMDFSTAIAFLDHLRREGIIGENVARLTRAAVSDHVLRAVPAVYRDQVRADFLRSVLLQFWLEEEKTHDL